MRWPWQKAASAASATTAAEPSGPGATAPDASGKKPSPPPKTLVIDPFAKTSRRFPAQTITPERMSQIARDADEGDVEELQELYDDIATDAEVEMLLSAMTLPIMRAPWKLEAGEDSDRGRRIAAEATAFVQAIPAFPQLKAELVEAEYRAFAAIQPSWVVRDRRWWIDGWEGIEGRFFRFDNGEEPRVRTKLQPSGEPLPPSVLYYLVRKRPGPVARGGIGRAILKPWLYKGFCLVDGMSFLERFGHPHVQVKLGPNIAEGSPELERAKSAAKAIIVDNAALVPAGVELQILDSVQKAATVKDVYLAFVEWCDAAMAKAFLGQSVTSDDNRGSDTHAKVKGGLVVKQELTESRVARLDEFLSRALLRPWTDYHFGTDAPAPRIVHDVSPPADEKEKAETGKAKAEEEEILSRRVGLPLSRKQLYAVHGYEPPEDEADAIGGTATSSAKEPGEPASNAVCPGCGEVIAFAEKKKFLRERTASSWVG